ncbi:capsular biosynthesis protein [Bacillus sp. RC]|nr:capsular biosynthesis protein [Bacillus sp. RC]
MRIKKHILKFINLMKEYNISIAVKLMVLKILKLNHQYDKVIKNILIKENSNLIKQYASSKNKQCTSDELLPIWVCWWQGYTDMPEIVLNCYKSIVQNSNNHPVYLITKENYDQYVNIPDHILEKLKKGTMTITHFSDFLRVALLRKYGGCWIDSTIYVSTPIPEDVFTKEFYSRRIPNNVIYTGKNVSNGKWSSYLLAGHKDGLLFEWIEKFLYDYWKRHDSVIDYFLTDYAIAVAVEKLPEINELVSKVPPNNPKIHELQKKLNEKFVEKEFVSLCNDTVFHKLNWRISYVSQVNHNKTYYGVITKKIFK